VRFKALFFWPGQNGAKGKSRAFLLLKCIILMDFNNNNNNNNNNKKKKTDAKLVKPIVD